MRNTRFHLRLIAVFLIGLPILPISAAPQSGEKAAPDKRSLTEINRAWMKEVHNRVPSAGEKATGARTAKTEGTAAGTPGSNLPQPAREAGTQSMPENAAPPGETLRLANPGTTERHEPQDPGRPALFDKGAEETSFLSVVFRFVAILVVMLGAFYMFARYTRGRRGMAGTGGDLVHVVVSVPLIQGKFLQVVDLAGRLLVLGVSDQSVSLLSEVADARTADRIRLWQSQNRSVPEAARGALGRLTTLIRGTDFRFWNSAGEGKDAGPQRESFRSVLREQGGSALPGAQADAGGAEGTEGMRPRGRSVAGPVSRAAKPAVEAPPESGVVSAVASRDLFDFDIPEEPGARPDADEAELHELLRAQRKRLQKLKSTQD